MNGQKATSQSSDSENNGGAIYRHSTYVKRPILVSRRPLIDIVKPSQSLNITPMKPKQTLRPSVNSIKQANKTSLPNLIEDQVSYKEQSKSKRGFWLMAMSIVVFSIGVGVTIAQLKANSQVTAQVRQSNHLNNSSNLAPNEDHPHSDSLNNYQVASSLPRFITIPTLSVKARVKRLGVNQQSQLEAPDNIYDAGWYEDSAKPGDKGGAILIDGHVHGPTKPGVFVDLVKLKADDLVQIERGDGQKYNFKVVKLQAYDANNLDMKAALTPIITGKLGLNLITCTGPIKPGSHDYSKRLIVFTVQQ